MKQLLSGNTFATQTPEKHSESNAETEELLNLAGFKGDKKELSPRLARLIETNLAARRSFVPTRFRGEIILFRANKQGSRLKYSRFFSKYRWSDFAEHIREVRVPGSHLVLLEHPYVEKLADEINKSFRGRDTI